MNLEDISKQLTENLEKLDTTDSMNEKISNIDESQKMINDGELILKRYKNTIDTYQATPNIENVNIDNSMQFIENSIEKLDDINLDECMQIYGNVMDEISNLELFMSQKKKEYQIVE